MPRTPCRNAALAQLTAQAAAAGGPNAQPQNQAAPQRNQAGDVTVIADDRTNSLVIRAIPATMDWIRKMVHLLDTQTPEVLIEAKVIEAAEQFSRAINGGLAGFNGGDTASGGFSASNVAGTLLQPLDPLFGDPNSQELNGAAASLSSGFANGLFGFNLGPASGPRLSMILNLAESESQLKQISAPKSVVMNKQKATVVQGTPVIVPMLVTTQYGPQTMESVQQANLKLEVTPTVTSDGSVLMDLEVTRDVVQAAQGSSRSNAAAVAPRNIKTNVLVENGSTIVLGGFYTSDERTNSGGIPWLRKIPIIGTFFGGENKASSHDELFFFITPHILNPKKAGLTGTGSGQKKPHGQPQIYEYLRKYQEDPTSRIFAPLAEAYRKAGLVDEAVEIAREGLRFHPTFIGGRVALARCLFDKKLYQDVVDELSNVVRDVPDNLVAQRIIAEKLPDARADRRGARGFQDAPVLSRPRTARRRRSSRSSRPRPTSRGISCCEAIRRPSRSRSSPSAPRSGRSARIPR